MTSRSAACLAGLLGMACGPSGPGPKIDTASVGGSDTTPTGTMDTSVDSSGTETGGVDTSDTAPSTETAETADTALLETGSADTAVLDTGTLGPGVSIDMASRVVCEDPAAREVDGPYVATVLPGPAAGELLEGSGLIVADLRGEPMPEIIAVGEGSLVVFEHDGTMWVDVTAAAAPGLVLGELIGGSAADYDGDGDLDVFLAADGANLLLRNDLGVLADATADSGLGEARYRSVSGSWADIDQDGDLDLFVGNYAAFDHASAFDRVVDPSELYLGHGDGTFEDVSDRLPFQVQDGFVFASGFYDLDDDRYPELVTPHDFGQARTQSTISRNEEAAAFEPDNETGFHPHFFGMGIAVADLNADGKPDWVQTGASTISLLLSSPWPDAATGWGWHIEYGPAWGLEAVAGDRHHHFGWGVEVVDLDNDADLDVHAIWGHWEYSPDVGPVQHDGLWINEDDHFTEQGAAWGIDDSGPGRGLIAADLDGDGWLDLVKREIGVDGVVRVYMSRCGTASWSRIRLADPDAANPDGIGAVVTVVADGRSHTRWIDAGSHSMFSGGPPEAHVGVGTADVLDSVEIAWSDGRHDRLEDLPVDRVLTLRRRR